MSQSNAPLPVPTPAQCRAARAVLGWNVDYAAAATEVARNTILKLEGGGEVRTSTTDRLRTVFGVYGVTFNADGKGLSWNVAP